MSASDGGAADDAATQGITAEGAGSERVPSETAMGVARLRAMHQLRDGEPKILDDPVTPRLLGAKLVERIRQADLSAEPPGLAGLRSHVVLRSRYAEDRLHDAVARGVAQFVLLGAGLDTFAYRQPAWAHGLRVFEVDHAASQAAKRRLLAERGIEAPSNVRYATADFEAPDTIVRALAEQGFDMTRPAVAACLGVIVYLTMPAVDGLLQFGARLAEGSELIFTISAPHEQTRETFAARAAAVGEPWLTFLAPDDVLRRLRAFGFRDAFQPTIEALTARYFSGRSDALPPPRRSTLVVALR
jgi:methyltransferase (TIGR00027 family)